MRIPLKFFIESIGLSLEKGTGDVPNDGRYYLVVDGEIIGSWKSEKEALKAYREKAKELGYEPKTPRQKADLEKEIAHKYFAAYDAYWDSAHKFRKKGGKGR